MPLSDSAPPGPALPLPQARVPGMDGDAAAGHVPAVLCPCQHAHLHRLHEPGLRLEQERSRHCAQQLLLGLLPDSDPGWPPGGPVTARSPLPCWAAELLGEASWELGDPRPRGWVHSPFGCSALSEGSWGGGDGWTDGTLCSHPRPPPQRLWLSATLENSSEKGWPEPHLAVSVAGSLALQLSLAPQLPHHCPLGPSRIGGEKVILLSASAWGFLTAATPLLAHLGSAHLVFMTFSRILTGLLQGRRTSGASLTGGVRLC